MKTWKTNIEEIADVIFNSPDAELNDMLCEIALQGKYDIRQLLLDLTLSVNNSFPLRFRSDGSDQIERRHFLHEELRLELTYYIMFGNQRAPTRLASA
ncbi:MAG: hypothetical protein QM762_13575 [Chryseolinea sp.]